METEQLILSLCEKEKISRKELYEKLEAYLERVYTGEEMDASLKQIFSNKPSVETYLAWLTIMNTYLEG